MSNIPVSQSNAPQNSNQTDWLKIILSCLFSCFGTLLVVIFGFGVLMVCLNASFNESQQNNQIVRPDPTAPPPPVVPALPTLVAELSRVKTVCEDRAREAKNFIRHHHVRERDIRIGQRHYTGVRSELNGIIDHLRAGLSVRFTNDDLGKIRERFKTASARMNEFISWADALEHPQFGAIDPLDVVREMYLKWLESVRKSNDDAIQQLRGS